MLWEALALEGFGKLLKSLGKEALGSSGKPLELWEGLQGSGRLWKSLVCFGRLWEALAASVRVCKALEGFGGFRSVCQLWKALGSFSEVLKGFGKL